MISSFDKEIMGNTYTITQLPARQNLLFISKWAKNLKPVAPLLDSMSSNAVTSVLDAGLTDLNLSKMLETLCDSLDPDRFSNLVFDSFKGVRVMHEGKSIDLGTGSNFDVFFAGNIKALFAVLWQILKINMFGDETNFFSNLTTKAKQVLDAQGNQEA